MVGGGDEIGEGVAFVEELAGFVPAATQIGRAPDVGDSVNETAVEQADSIGRKRGLGYNPVRTVPVEIERIRTIAVDTAAPGKGYGHPLAIGSGGEDALAGVLAGIVSAEDVGALLQIAQD